MFIRQQLVRSAFLLIVLTCLQVSLGLCMDEDDGEELVQFPPTVTEDQRLELDARNQPRRDRYNRMRHAVKDMYQNSLVVAEYFLWAKKNNAKQILVWDELRAKISAQSLNNHLLEIHYINLDNPTLNKIEIHEDTSKYALKYQENKRIISMVVFRPKSSQGQVPVTIYTHGGKPTNYFKPNKINPMLTAFAGLGYAIVCPNYRGGSAQNHEEDISAVVNHLKTLPYIDASKIVLSGISGGTTLNAAIVDKPIMREFAGVFLHTGLYQTPGLFAALLGLPSDLPLFLASGGIDKLVDLNSTLKYIRAAQDIAKNFSYFIAENGGHQLIEERNPHIISYELAKQQTYSEDDLQNITNTIAQHYNSKEMLAYITQLVEFLDKIAYGEIPRTLQDSQVELRMGKAKPKGIDVVKKARMAAAIKKPLFGPNVLQISDDIAGRPYTFSTAHLKIILGDEYDETDLETTILKFLTLYDSQIASIGEEFKAKNPLDGTWEARVQVKTAESENLKRLIYEILKKEEEYKGSYVLYHGTSAQSGFIYDVYSAMRRLLLIQGEEEGAKRKNVSRLRALDDAFTKIISAEDLLTQMQSIAHKYPDSLLNYLPGYQNVGVSAQWFLFGSYKYWANSTFMRYFLEGEAATTVTIESVLTTFFTAIGFTDPEVIKKMIKKYEEIYRDYIHEKDGRLLQIFISPTIIDEVVYISETGGYPLDLKLDPKSAVLTHHPSKAIPLAVKSPVDFETILKGNRDNFKRQGVSDRQEFATNKPGLRYINSVEARFFMKPEYMDDPQKIQILNYHRYAPKVRDGNGDDITYDEALEEQVAEDFASWLDLVAKPKLGAAMTLHAPSLVKLQDYVEQGSTGQKPIRQAFTLYDLLSAGKWQQAEEWLIIHPTDINVKMDEQGRPLLYHILANNNFAAAEWLIKHGASANDVDDKGLPVILSLLEENNTQAVEFLVKSTGNVIDALKDKVKLTEMIQQKRSTLAVWLIESGADINAVSKEDGTLLFYAASVGLTDVVNALIKKKAMEGTAALQEYVNRKTKSQSNALLIALSKGHKDTALALIQAGADIHVMTKDNITPLILAASLGLTDVVIALIVEEGAKGADALHTYLEYKIKNDMNALLTSISNGHEETALALIQAGASINVETSKGITPLFLAANEGLTNVVLSLIGMKEKEGIDALHGYLNHKSVFGATALIAALNRGYPDTALALIHAGADISMVDVRGSTPLILAVNGKLEEVVRTLIEKKAQEGKVSLVGYLNAQNKQQVSPLLMAIEKRYQNLALLLLDAGGNVNGVDAKGSTPLILAASVGLKDVVTAIIAMKEKEGDGPLHDYLDFEPPKGGTALAMARAKGHKEIVEILIQAGAVK